MKAVWITISFWVLLELFLCQTSATYNDQVRMIRRQGNTVQDDLHEDGDVKPTLDNAMAHLLVDKRFLNNFIVESMELVVEYRIFNVGVKLAKDVRLWDPSLENRSKFALWAGLTDVGFGVIPPGSNVSHYVVVRPLEHGPVDIEPAQVFYRSEMIDFFGSSGVPTSVYIWPNSVYHQKFCPHFQEWTAFAFFVVPSLLIPYLLWFSSNAKYESLINDLGEGVIGRKKRMQLYRYR